MMLTCLYHIFSKQEALNPADTDYSAVPEEMYEKFQEQYDKNAIKQLLKRGYTIIPTDRAWYQPEYTFVIW